MLTLRPYQSKAVEAMLAHPPGGPRGALLVASVGAGKTEMGLAAALRVLEGGGRVVWAAHRQELLEQPRARMLKNRALAKWGLRAGIVQGTRSADDMPIVFASIATITKPRRLERILKYGRPELLVVDECHHGTAASYQPVLEAFAGARRIGLTATPDRTDGASLADQWEIVYSYDIADAVRDGWLVEPYVHRYHLPRDVERSVNEGRLDLEDPDQSARDLMAHVVRHTVQALGQGSLRVERLPWRDDRQTLQGGLRGRSGLVFCSTIAQARATAEALNADGWVARSISGDPSHTDLETRALLLREYAAGRVQVLCNADLLTEGFDAPRTEFVAFARATRSRPLFVQILGRAMRLFDPAWSGAAHEMNRLHAGYRGRRIGVAVDLVGCSEEHSIIAAPVLVADACKHAPERSGDGAWCPKCEKKWPCWRSLTDGGDGQHFFRPDPEDDNRPRCRWCQRLQCVENPDTGRHVWGDRTADHKFKCQLCPAEYTDPLASLVKGRRDTQPDDQRFVTGDDVTPGDVALVRVQVADPEVWAVGLDAHGVLLLSGSRAGAGWWAVRWNEVDVGPGGYTTRHAWAVAADVIRQTTRRKQDAAKGREVWAGLDEAGCEDLIARARQLLGASEAA